MAVALRRGALALALGFLVARAGLVQAQGQEQDIPLAPAHARSTSTQQASESDMLLLEVRVDRQLVSEAVVAYQSGEYILLPLGELSRLLTLAITTDPGRGTASGFVLEQGRSFGLDLARATVVLAGQAESFDPAQVELRTDDIYVSTRLLARWLPIDVEVDLSRLSLEVRPRERLPLQFRLDREAQGARAGARDAERVPGYPRHDIPYQLVGTPFLDQTLSLDYRGGNGRNSLDSRYTAYATGDVLGMQGALYVSAASGGDAADARFTLGRQDPDAELLGLLRARTALVGSVPVPAVAHISRSSALGEGYVISNRLLSQPDSFGQHSLQGPLPPGWDVELYFNEALVGFQASGTDGRYHFDDLQLLFGPNEFRLVFHGPLGEVRVERETFLLEQSLTPAGEFRYLVAQHRDEEGHARLHAQFDWGLTEHLGATGGIVRTPVAETVQDYANVGLRAHWRSLIVGGELARSGDGGSLVQATLRTRLGRWSINAGHAQLDDFTSEWFLPAGDPVRSSTTLRADGRLPWPSGTVRLPLTIDLSHEARESGASHVDLAGRLSANVRGTAVTGQLRWREFDGQGADAQELADATVQLSRRVHGFSVRSQLNYAIAPDSRLTSVAIAADRRLGAGYLQSFGVTRLFDSSETLYTTGLTKSLGSFGLGINAGYSSSGDLTVGLRLFLAMGREPRTGHWHLDALPMANTGAVSALAFLDDNMNGRMDPGEQPIEGAGFSVNEGRQAVATNAQGIAYLERLPVLRHADVAVLTDTLEDPQWLPTREGVRVVPRPGAVAQLQFPVIMTSEIDGTVYLLQDQRRREVGSLVIEIVDGAGRVVATGTSAADGYYVVTGVPVGEYRVRVSPEQMQRLGLASVGTQEVSVTRDGWFVSGVDVEVRTASD
ncbi:MAG: carboxypeptidase-like regulatory domain-containing protein [Proteobacteria bacterium]|nr:carboxypeptidase-like regulatory domain-containing protein [Pseudomonadota bacterium]